MAGVVAAGAIQGGAELLESVINRLFEAGDRKRLKRFIGRLQGQIGQQVFSGQELASFQNRIFGSRIGEINKFAEQTAQRLDIDSGPARGELFDRSFQIRADIGTQLGLESKRLGLQRDAQLRRLISSGLTSLT